MSNNKIITYGPIARIQYHAGKMNCCCFNSLILCYIAFTYLILRFIFPYNHELEIK